MISSKTSLSEHIFDFKKELTDEHVLDFPLFMHPELLPHEPPTDWSMKTTGWPHLRWTDAIIPSSLEDLEGIHFTHLDLESSSDTMVEGRAQFVLEYNHIPREKGYWCRIGEEGMMAHEYIISETNEEDIFMPVCIYHFEFGLCFPLHPFFSQILCHVIFPSTNFFLKLSGR